MFRAFSPVRSGPPLKRTGFSLAEALIATTILATVSVSAALPFVAGTQQVQGGARLEQAVALGQSMMDEIVSRPFYEPGEFNVASPGPGADEATRNLYNNVDDYDAVSETVGSIRDYSNGVISDVEFSGLRRTVTAQYVSFSTQAATDTNSFVRVYVKVYDDTTLLVTLTRLVARED